MYTILIPLLENIHYKVLIPVNIIINKGIPKVQIINSYKYKNEISNKIKSLLKLYGILKFKQILIEFPEFPDGLINLRYYASILVEIIKSLLTKKNTNKQNFINLNTYIQKRSIKNIGSKKQDDVVYIDKKLILEHSISGMQLYVYKGTLYKLLPEQHDITTKLQFISKYSPAINTIILTPLPEISINQIKLLLKLKHSVTIHNKIELIKDTLNLSIPRNRIIYNIKTNELTKRIQLLMLKNTKNFIIVPTCNCGKLFSTLACNCTRTQIYNHLKNILALANYIQKIYIYNPTLNKIHKTSINYIHNQYRSIL